MCCFRGDTLGGGEAGTEGTPSRKSKMKCFLTVRNPFNRMTKTELRQRLSAFLVASSRGKSPRLQMRHGEQSTEVVVGGVKSANKGNFKAKLLFDLGLRVN